jgi:SAM-dependent methyltransferase
MSHQRVIGLYEENADQWDCDRGDRLVLEREWLDRFTCGLPAGGTILDVGCGSGRPIAAELIRRGFRVTGVDSSPSLIQMCAMRFPEQEWLVGDMRELALGRRFDGVLAWHSSFHLTPDDQRVALSRLAAHVATGGRLMFTSGPERGERLGEWQGEPLYSASLAPAEYRQLLEEGGLQVVAHQADDPECGGATVWLAQMSPASGLEGSA